MSEDSISEFVLIQKFQLLQEERAHSYKLFEEGHKIYLNSAEYISKFRQLIKDVTEEFKRISTAIIAIEKQLRFNGFSEAADIVSKMQEMEKTKLEFIINLQMAKKEAIDNPDLPQKWNKVKEIKQNVRDVIELMNEQVLELRQLKALLTEDSN